MEFFRFLEGEAKTFDRRLLLLGCLAAIINLFILAGLTTAVSKAITHQSNFAELVSVVVGISAYWLSQGIVLRRTTTVVEEIVAKVRLRIAEKIRTSDLVSIENIGRAPLYNAVSTHASSISRAATGIITAFTALVLLVCAALIILYMSPKAFLILAGGGAVLSLIFNIYQARSNRWLTAAVRADNQFSHAFGNLIDGFKELKMNARKADDFMAITLGPLAAKTQGIRTEAGLALNRVVLMMTSGLFINLAVLVFLLPAISPDEVAKLPALATFLLFLFGPAIQVFANMPFLSEAGASVREIRRIEKHLDSIYERGHADPVSSNGPTLQFDTLRCTGLTFNYRDEHDEPSFSLEPLNFLLSKGELVFVTGGNGSGKSTFLKVLAGLYPSMRGTIAVNDVVIGSNNRQSYRHLFSTVFSDFHLFDRLYGIKDIQPDRVRYLLDLTGLSHKTSIVDDQITALTLSSGERKRLALVLSVLEDKPILLLDEWAAEQDPPFRRKFYRQILPWLKDQQKTVVAVTHDDDHYDVADRVLKMRFGKFVAGGRD